jgi:pimeloyl-ACP methyl ester carboxylesterase
LQICGHLQITQNVHLLSKSSKMIQMENKSYVADGARLSYVEAGSGVPVLFLHPTPLDHFYWLPLIQRLPKLRAIVLDLRAHGASELGAHLPLGGFPLVPDAPTLTMEQLATDTLVLLDQLDLSEAIFVGCSIGGYVMLELWRRTPQRMRGLAFICSKPQPDAESNLMKRADTIAKARAGERDALFDSMAQTSTSATAKARHPAIVSEVRARMTLTVESIVAVHAGLAARPDSIPTVGTITAPIFAVAGGEDNAVSPAEMEVFRGAPGGCDFHLLPDAGHFSAFEQPEMIAALLTPWLKQFGV